MAKQNNNFSKDILKIYRNNPKCLKLIFDYNLNNGPIDRSDNNGNNIIHYIVMNNDAETLSSVLNHVNYFNLFSTSVINMQNKNGDTPMHIAVRNNNEVIAKMLDNAGADLTIKNRRGERIKEDERSNGFDMSDFQASNRVSSEEFLENLANALQVKSSGRRQRINPMSIEQFMIGGNDEESLVADSSIVLKFVGDDTPDMSGGRRRRNTSKKDKRSKRSASRSNESSDIHDQVVASLKELSENEEDARAIKAGLYGMVKEKNPELNNLDRAKKMLEYMKDKSIMKNLMDHIDDYKKIIAEARKMKEAQGKSVDKEKKEKKNKSSESADGEKKVRKTKKTKTETEST